MRHTDLLTDPTCKPSDDNVYVTWTLEDPRTLAVGLTLLNKLAGHKNTGSDIVTQLLNFADGAECLRL